MGAGAIQLAVASGYEVVTTCSPHNFEFVKKIFAGAFEGKDCAGALTIGAGSVDRCIDVVARCKGNKFVSMASLPVSVQRDEVRGLIALVSLVFALVSGSCEGVVEAYDQGSEDQVHFWLRSCR